MRVRIGLLFLCLFSGCASSVYMPIGGQTYPPRPDDYVIDVYLSTDMPVIVQQSIPNAKPIALLSPHPLEIGRIDTYGGSLTGWGTIIEDAQKKARILGGDAIVVKQWGLHLQGIGAYGSAQYGKNISSTVIRRSP